jgi:hypothetical protein
VKSRILALLLTLCILSQVGGIWVLYTTAIAVHKQNKELRMSDQSKWIARVFSLDSFHALLEGEDELVIDGVMFDIVSATEHNSLVTAILVEDRAENKLKNTLSGIQKSHSGWSETARMAVSFGISPYVMPVQPAMEQHFNPSTEIEHASFYLVLPVTHALRSIDHPPSLEV